MTWFADFTHPPRRPRRDTLPHGEDDTSLVRFFVVILFSSKQRPFAYNRFVTVYLAQGFFRDEEIKELALLSQEIRELHSRSPSKIHPPSTLRSQENHPPSTPEGPGKPPAKYTPVDPTSLSSTGHCTTYPDGRFNAFCFRVIPRTSFAFTSEVSREAARGRSRRFGGLRETEVLLCEGTALAELRPRAPRTRLRPTTSTWPIMGGVRRGLAGSSILRQIVASPSTISSVTSQPLVQSRTPPGRRRDRPRSGCLRPSGRTSRFTSLR